MTITDGDQEQLTESPEFLLFCSTAFEFWQRNLLPGGERVILVEAMSQDIRVTLRNLTFANALRRFLPARLVVFTGADDDWNEILWTFFDAEALAAISHAYGAVDVIDIHDLVDSWLDDPERGDLRVAGKDLPVSGSGIDPAVLEEFVRATVCRVLKVPRVTDEIRAGAKYAGIRERSAQFSDIYDALFAGLDPVALVTSHVDYNHWGLAVETATRFNVPTVHVQSTGTFKAYALFPETRRGTATFRAELTPQIAEFYEQYVWSNRDRLRSGAELSAWRLKGNWGKPSWWRGGAMSAIELQTPEDRLSVREHALARFGFDPDKPVVAVYNHAISDAPRTNVELFDDLAAWYEATADFAVKRDDVNWLFIDHPNQYLYDATGFFDSLKERHADSPLVFLPSLELSKNVMWSLVDLGITVRGSISNELPAFGIPALQAGWSEWSQCGFTIVAKDADDYWNRLAESIESLLHGRPLLTEEQIERARLWGWFYRGGTDVSTQLVQHWEMGRTEHLLLSVRVAMQHVEADADPAFTAVRRMWARKDPFLTRIDMRLPAEEFGLALGGVGEL
ncbi:hypothetical protein [Kribbella sp. VKM Ac-2568]|uniref:hypothetical protein n=1 Tax=Kribbella sp. VKM Ac-2568 TaxID=2512219 RepID=UPI00104C049C|nr:hypothetical protein [Kribbella sp. VKM Ac-2568]TCM50317.1 hypothetical protein EV648_102361 [Kribbella sp. VKM Ac-2568]